MQSFSASPSRQAGSRLLVVELWGLGDVALALPFVRAAAQHVPVSLLAKPHAEVLVRRLCPEVEFIPFTAPWTAHRRKYELHRWPWSELNALVETLRRHQLGAAVSVRPDPRDHLIMALAGANVRAGFPRAGSSVLLTERLPLPANPHRSAAWAVLAGHFGWKIPATSPRLNATQRGIVMHTGAAQPTRVWPRERFDEIAARLRAAGRAVTVLDAQSGGLDALVATLATADRFIGNDSGPGHVAALLGVPTFTIAGPHPAALFHPAHPQAAWIEGAPCPYKPCRDYCHYDRPHCIQDVTVETVWNGITRWLENPVSDSGRTEGSA